MDDKRVVKLADELDFPLKSLDRIILKLAGLGRKIELDDERRVTVFRGQNHAIPTPTDFVVDLNDRATPFRL